MFSKVKDGMLAAVKDGLPMITTTMGAALGATKTSSVWKVSGYAGLGWLAGHLTQRAFFALIDHKAEIPEEVAPLAPEYSRSSGNSVPSMPPVDTQPPSASANEGLGRVINLPNYGSQGFDPSATGS